MFLALGHVHSLQTRNTTGHIKQVSQIHSYACRQRSEGAVEAEEPSLAFLAGLGHSFWVVTC